MRVAIQNDLELLVDPGKNPDVDIVFIAAIHDKRLQSWTIAADGLDVVWPRDLLGADLLNARISSYEYHISDWKAYDKHARDLTTKLEKLRAGDTRPCPIVLVAHSISGLVTAKVISEDTAIDQHVQGLAFFATPFQDPDGGAPVTTLTAIAKRCGYSSEGITGDAYVLKEWLGNASRPSSTIKIAAFTELPSDTALVTDDAVKAPSKNYFVQGLPGEHDEICKFGSRKGFYPVVSRAIERLARVRDEDPEADALPVRHTRDTHRATNHGIAVGSVSGGMHFYNQGTITYFDGWADTLDFDY